MFAVFPSRDQFRELVDQGNLIPLATSLVADVETPVSAFAKLRDLGHSFLFESAEKNESLGRFSFIGTDPLLIFQSSGSTISITEDGQTQSFETASDPLSELQKVMARFRFVPLPHTPHFIGGAVGFLGYDVVRLFEPKVPIHTRDDLQLPEVMFIIARSLVVFDHRFRTLHLISHAYCGKQASVDSAYEQAEANLQRIVERLKQATVASPIPDEPAAPLPPARSNTSRPEFETMVHRAKQLIAAGDIFQVVLSQRFETEYVNDPLDLYRCLRFGNPSPYMFYLSFGSDFTAIGSSPELHVRVRNSTVEIRPIAGTRPRGIDPAEDQRLSEDLLRDPKERAEHVMLIDLGRNDLGRVAEFGTVKVTEQMVIERYSHVMHIVSHVAARLRDNMTGFDAVRATFPAGTVSGAPKIRAMQVIAELEKSRRGFYAGIVGYFGFDGTLDSCIALRSIVLKNGRAYLQAGAGIVADSNPAREYEETMNKAKAMLEAIGRAKKL